MENVKSGLGCEPKDIKTYKSKPEECQQDPPREGECVEELQVEGHREIRLCNHPTASD